VTVNETVYQKDNGGMKTVFRIKVINVSPNEEKEAAEKVPSSTENTSVEEIVEVDIPAKTPETTDASSEEVDVTSSKQEEPEFNNEIPIQVGPNVV